jgi:hemerythrin-like domain-containing protein
MMDSIELMVYEHKVVKRMLRVIRHMCFLVLKNQEMDYNDFFDVVDFTRNYTDGHHHGKEEDILFSMMVDELGPIAEKLITHGMLIEHELGRLYIQQLEEAVRQVLDGNEEAKLDLIANAIAYADLLNRHIDKEGNVVYTYARKNLSKESLDKLEEDCGSFEHGATSKNVQASYIEMLERLERKFDEVVMK